MRHEIAPPSITAPLRSSSAATERRVMTLIAAAIGMTSATSMPVRSRAVWALRSEPNIQAMPSAAAPAAIQVPAGTGSLRKARASSVVSSGLTLITTSALAVLVSVSEIMKAVNITLHSAPDTRPGQPIFSGLRRRTRSATATKAKAKKLRQNTSSKGVARSMWRVTTPAVLQSTGAMNIRTSPNGRVSGISSRISHKAGIFVHRLREYDAIQKGDRNGQTVFRITQRVARVLSSHGGRGGCGCAPVRRGAAFPEQGRADGRVGRGRARLRAARLPERARHVHEAVARDVTRHFGCEQIGLHAFEEVGVAPADFKLLRAPLDRHELAAALVADDAGDGARIDQGGAVDLPELLRIELGDQFSYWFTDERFLLGGLHARVFLVRDEEQHVVDRDHLDLVADRGLDPFQPRGRLELLGEPGQRLLQRVGRGRRRGEALLQALDGDGEALALGGLQHVVDHALLEGVDRVLVVGGDEDDLGRAPFQLGDVARRLHSGLGRHADVEEDHIGAVLFDHLDGFDAVLRFGHDLELGPQLGEARAQLAAHQGLVVGDYRTGHFAL